MVTSLNHISTELPELFSHFLPREQTIIYWWYLPMDLSMMGYELSDGFSTPWYHHPNLLKGTKMTGLVTTAADCTNPMRYKRPSWETAYTSTMISNTLHSQVSQWSRRQIFWRFHQPHSSTFLNFHSRFWMKARSSMLLTKNKKEPLCSQTQFRTYHHAGYRKCTSSNKNINKNYHLR